MLYRVLILRKNPQSLSITDIKLPVRRSVQSTDIPGGSSRYLFIISFYFRFSFDIQY